jgi:methyl-accepting chemotaxis protein
MTENQEKEVFLLLNNIVTQVQSVQSDVKEIKQTVNEHSLILNEHSRILNKHYRILDEHSRILNRVDAKTDSIAETVMTNDKRLTVVEKDVSNLRGEIH